jgi:tetratricopeptide (TPR) repeat protein
MNRLGAVPLVLIIVSLMTGAQSSAPRSSAPTTSVAASTPPQAPAQDYSREPLVIDQYFTKVRYENDGTGERDLAVRVRVQNDAGVQQLTQLVFGYESENEEFILRYLRVLKPDGTVVTADADSVKETSAPIAHDAPAYSDLKEKHITVPPLTTGAVLEYEVATRVVTPPAPGDFWFQHNFLAGAIVLDERLEINIPESRKVNLVSSPAFPHTTENQSGRAIYRWKRANLSLAAADSSKADSEPKEVKPPDVQLSSFATWDAVAHWYAKLKRSRTEPTPEIRAKTQELIQGRAGDLDKMQAIYDYVSQKIRYVDLSFGTGSYQPHSAAEVFANRYGDSKDKHVLLASMLQAAGFSADAVLVPLKRKLQISLPSPAQFDHVLTAVPRGAELIWMDTTPEVAPFRLLASPLRRKLALLVRADGSGKIDETPADPPFLSTQHVDVDGQVSELGKLTATAHYAVRGDTELVLRLAFHKTPESQWHDLGQTILALDGIHGEVATVKPGDPFATRDPFTLDIGFVQSNFLDWSSKKQRTQLPLLAIGLPDAPGKSAQPVNLGSPLNVTVRLTLRLPPSLTARTPVAASVARDYAEFKSSYQFADHTVTAQRSLDFKMHEVPASRIDDYQAFARAVAADQNQALVVENTAPGAPVVPASASADDLFEAGLATLNSGNAAAAIPLFERVIQLDPKYKQAWNDLGLSYLRGGKYDEGAISFRKQLELDPSDAHANDYLGVVLNQQKKYSEAADAFRKQIAVNPLDTVAHAALGGILLEQHDYAQAVIELEKATILSPENAELEVSLGRAYANSGKQDEALAAFEKAVAMSQKPAILNAVAYNLADQKLNLDKAQQYAQSAISSTASDLRDIDLAHLKAKQVDEVANISSYWDTLGWVYFQKGDSQKALQYIQAAWLLDQQGAVGDHLAQVYEKLGEKDRAIHTYALALAAPNPVPETRARLTLLLGGNSQIDDLVSKAKPELESMRSIPAGKLLSEDAQAVFFVLLQPGEKAARVSAVRFVGGSDKLQPFAERLRSLDYGPVFPDASTAKLARRGTLSCSAKTSDCTFTLAPPEDLRTIN